MRYLVAMGLLLSGAPALAGSESSNSSSNCSNGRCTRLDSLVIEDDRGRRGHLRREHWREGGGRPLPRGEIRFGLPGWAPLPLPRGRPWRDDDDD